MGNEISLLERIFEKGSLSAVTIITTEGVIATWNPRAAEVFSLSADEVKGKSLDILTPPPLKEGFHEILNRIKRAELIGFYVISLDKQDKGITRIVIDAYPVKNDSGQLIAALIICHDVTEQSQKVNFFNELAGSSPFGVYIVQEGKFKYVSRQFAAILGYSEEELLNTASLDYVYPEDREKVRANAVAALKGGNQNHKPYEFRIKNKSGELKWIMETVTSILYVEKKATLGNFMDITEQKRTQEEIERANEKLAVVIKQMEEGNHQNAILMEVRDLLQACSSAVEITPIIKMGVQKLFPGTDGALFLMSPSRNDLESTGRWGNFPEDVDDNVFSPNDCWGLRQGKAYIVENADIGLVCPHLKHLPKESYMCLPLMAKSDVLGLLHVRGNIVAPGDRQSKMENIKNLAATLTGVFSMAIANVKLEENLTLQSILDPLSGLYNRRYMEEAFQREIIRAMRKDSQIGVIMADIDHFKNFNDTCGHAAGDKMITAISKVFKGKIRGSDIACRYGGEEFVILLPDLTLEDSYKRAEYLREEITKLTVIHQDQLLSSVTISMGVVAYPIHGKNIDTLLRAADVALYKAKQQGRNRVVMG